MNNNAIIREAILKITNRFQVCSVKVAEKYAQSYQACDYDFEIRVSGSVFIFFRLNYHGSLKYLRISNTDMTNSAIMAMQELYVLFGPIKAEENPNTTTGIAPANAANPSTQTPQGAA